MCDARAPSVREASQRARSVEGEEIQRCVDTGRWNSRPWDERGETATVDQVRVTGTSLGRTDANDECPSQKCTTSEHWQPNVFSSPTSVPRYGRKVSAVADDGSQEEVRLKVSHSKEECDVRLPRAQGSFIATCVRTSKEARPCGSDRDGGVY